MRDLLEAYNNPTLFSSFCDVSRGKFLPNIEIEEAVSVIHHCKNEFRKNIITCKDTLINEFLEEVDGLEFNITLNSRLSCLPSYIPIVDYNTQDISNIPEEFPFIGISLWDILSSGIIKKAGALHEDKNICFHNDILSSESFRNKKVILFLTGADTMIEWIWWNRVDCNLFKKLYDMGFWAVTGFNFSVIGGECPFAQAINLKRSLFSAYLIEQNGLIAIPHVYALTKHHVNRWVNWFKINPNIHCFSLNCQLQKTEYDINQVVEAVKSILQKIEDLHVILQGFPLNKVWEFGLFLNRVHFADKTAIKKAQSGIRKSFDYTKNKYILEKGVSKSIEALSIENMINIYQSIENKRKLNSTVFF